MSAVNAGYPDGQRLTQAQSLSPFWILPAGNYNAAQSSGPQYCGNFPYLIAHVNVQARPALFTLSWEADANGTVISQSVMTLLTLNGIAVIVLPVLAPYCQLFLGPFSGSQVLAVHAYLATQGRVKALDQTTEVLFTAQAVALAANASTTLAQESNASGSTGFYVNGGTRGVLVSVQYFDRATQTWTNLAHYSVAISTDDYRQIVLPTGVSQVVLTNLSTTTAATGISLVATQDH